MIFKTAIRHQCDMLVRSKLYLIIFILLDFFTKAD